MVNEAPQTPSPNPRRPWLIAVGCLCLAAMGYYAFVIARLWHQYGFELPYLLALGMILLVGVAGARSVASGVTGRNSRETFKRITLADVQQGLGPPGRAMIWILIVLLVGQYIALAAWGIAHDYSLQISSSVHYATLGLLLLPLVWRRKSAWFVPLTAIILAPVFQDWYSSLWEDVEGERLYNERRFEEALVSLKDLNNAWYFHLPNNKREADVEHLIAKTYTQLGQYDAALAQYAETKLRHRSRDAARAFESTWRLEKGLAQAAEYEASLVGASGLEKERTLYQLARTYRFDIRNEAAAIETLERVLALEEEEVWKDHVVEWIEEIRSEPPV